MNTTTILLVEDNPGDARLIRELFRDIQGRSFDILTAESFRPVSYTHLTLPTIYSV